VGVVNLHDALDLRVAGLHPVTVEKCQLLLDDPGLVVGNL
jgi:hypothetical protein